VRVHLHATGRRFAIEFAADRADPRCAWGKIYANSAYRLQGALLKDRKTVLVHLGHSKAEGSWRDADSLLTSRHGDRRPQLL